MTEITKFDLRNPPVPLQEILDRVRAYMKDNNVISCCGPDVDLPYDIIASVSSTEGQILLMFNPLIIEWSDTESLLYEQFTATPGLMVKIRRPDMIKFRASSAAAVRQTYDFGGTTARVIQHEYDKLNGVDPMRRANVYHKERAYKKYAKYKKALDNKG